MRRVLVVMVLASASCSVAEIGEEVAETTEVPEVEDTIPEPPPPATTGEPEVVPSESSLPPTVYTGRYQVTTYVDVAASGVGRDDTQGNLSGRLFLGRSDSHRPQDKQQGNHPAVHTRRLHADCRGFTRIPHAVDRHS